MSNVIDFQAAVNARRHAAAAAAAEALKAKAVANEKAKLADHLGGGYGAELIADVVVEQVEKQRQAERAGKYVPAYCDPANEFKGCKYEAVKNLPVVQIAKRVREDIKALKLRKGFKISVRSDYNSIDVRVVGVPADFRYWSEERCDFYKQFGDDKLFRVANMDAHSAEYQDVKAKLQAIHDSYNRDNSDLSSDYFDVNYYGQVSFPGEWAALKVESENARDDRFIGDW